MTDEAKGILDIEYLPTACHTCNKILANTFIVKGDETHMMNLPFFVYCKGCMELHDYELENKE